MKQPNLYSSDEEIYLSKPVEQASSPAAEASAATAEETVELPPAEDTVHTLYELPEQRERNRKVFRMSDGSEQAVFYAEDVHVFDPDAQTYEEVDNSLLEEEDRRHYRNGRGGFAARFSREEADDELFSIEQGGHSVTFYAARSSRGLKNGVVPHLRRCATDPAEIPHSDVLVFEDRMPAADLEYTVNGAGIKENIVVKAKSAFYRYAFDLVCRRVVPEIDESDKTIRYRDTETGEEVFCTPAPFMTDAAGEYSDAVAYELRPIADGRYRLSVIADSAWMDAKERVFPVTIDPQITVTGSSTMRTYSWNNCTLSTSSVHAVGQANCSSGSSCSAQRMYMKLNKPTLPRNPRIKNATLTLRQAGSALTGGTSLLLGLYEVTGTLSEGYGEPAASDTLIDYRKATATNGTYTFDVTALVDKMISGETENAQLVLKAVDESASDCGYVQLYGTGGYYAPQLAITYDTNYGVNTSYRTHTHDLGRFGQGSIDLQCGNLMFESELFAWSGNRAPVTLKLLYNSALSGYSYTANSAIGLHTANFSAMQLGTGWKLNLQQSMVARNNGFVYVNENGEQIHFAPCTDASCGGGCFHYRAEDDSDMEYDCCTRRLTVGTDVYQFDTAGRLVSITDENGNAITMRYVSDRLSTVTDGAGRAFDLSYSTTGYLQGITAPDGTSIACGYENGQLKNICYPDGRRACVTYTTSGKPMTVQLQSDENVPQYMVTYTFAGDRLIGVMEQGMANGVWETGATTSYAYSAIASRTEVTVTEPADADETAPRQIKTTYGFDDDGNVISEYATIEGESNTAVSGNESGINPYMGENGMGIVSNADNLLMNSAFHSMVYWGQSASDCGCAATTVYAYEPYSKFGYRVLRMQSTSDCCAKGVHQDTVALPKGTYTFSAYLRVLSTFTGADNPGAYLRVTTTDGVVLAESERLRSRDSDFSRLVASFDVEDETSVQVHILMDGRGTLYADGAQLERHPYANPFNMLTNGNFEHNFTDWQDTTRAAVTTTEKFNMTRSLCIAGALESVCSPYQTVYVKRYTTTRETFTLSGWAKAPGLPEAEREGCESPVFELRAEIVYRDGTTETYSAPFAPGMDAWQFVSVQFSKQKFKAVNYIRVCCDYSYNAGVAYFDNIQLLRDSIETNLEEADFVDTTEEPVEENENTATAEGEKDEIPEFTEVTDTYGNPLTETTFTDGEFGTMYRSFQYNSACTDSTCCLPNAGNDLVEETDARGNKTQYIVDPETSRNTCVIDRCGNRTAYVYDEAGRTTQVTSQDVNGTDIAHVSYAYDAFNNLTEITRGDGMKYALTYNAFHNLQGIGVQGTGTDLVTYTYKNGNGRLKEVTYANGHTMKATYNSFGQLSVEKWYNASNALVAHYKYVYDGQGNIVRSIDMTAQKEYTYIYDEGKITSASAYDVTINEQEIITDKTLISTIRYAYGKDGKLSCKQVIVAGNEQTYQYTYPEEGNPIVKVTTNGVTFTSQSKNDHFGRKEFEELQTGKGFVSRQFSYVAGEVTEEHKQNGKLKSTPTTNLISQIVLSGGRTISYEYDPEERITKVIDSVDGETVYTYDALGQLLTEKHKPLGAEEYTTVNAMTYDRYGNIKTKNGVEYVYDEVWRDKLIAYNGQTITYDAQGNPLSYRGHTLTWEKGRQLKSLDGITYTYNANGIRTSKTVGGIRHDYVLDGAKILRECWNYDEVTKSYRDILVPLYDNEDRVCGIVYNGTPYYFLKNLQGDVISITDADGTAIANYTYDAWGKLTCITGAALTIATVNPFRYRGYYYDEDTKLYYLQSRYYDADVGRFINADRYVITNAIIGTSNLFAYCYNMPLNMIDCYGKVPEWLITASKIALGVVVVAGAAALTTVTFGSAAPIGVVLIAAGIGCAVGVSIDVASQYFRNEQSFRNFDIDQTILAGVKGGLSAILSVTGMGVLAQSIGNALISAGVSALNGDALLDVVFNALIGGLAGLVGGPGTGYGGLHFTEALRTRALMKAFLKSLLKSTSVCLPPEIIRVIKSTIERLSDEKKVQNINSCC